MRPDYEINNLLYDKVRIERILVAVAAHRTHVVFRGHVLMAHLAVVVHAVAEAHRFCLHMHGVVAGDAEGLGRSRPAVAYCVLKLFCANGIRNRLTIDAHMAVFTLRETQLAGHLHLAVRRIDLSPVAGHAADGIVRELAGMNAAVARGRMTPVTPIRRGLFIDRNSVRM